eukprot:UN22583
MRDAYLNVTSVAQEHDIDLDLAQAIVVVGPQGSGNDTIAQTFYKIPVTFSMKGTATTCPLKIISKRNPLLTKTKMTLNGDEIEEENLPSALKKHMTNIRDTKGFSEEELEVVIEGPDGVCDVVVILLPGFVRDQKGKIVDSIVAKYVRNPAHSLLVVLRATQDMADHGVIQHLDGLMTVDGEHVRPKWRDDAIFAFNYMNDQNTHREMQSAVTANTWFEEQESYIGSA